MSREEWMFLRVHEDQCQEKSGCFFVFTRINDKRRVDVTSCSHSRRIIQKMQCFFMFTMINDKKRLQVCSHSPRSMTREDCKFLLSHEDQFQVKMQCFFTKKQVNSGFDNLWI